MSGEYIVITVTKPERNDTRYTVTAQDSNGFYVVDAKCSKEMAQHLARICAEWFTNGGKDVSL